MQNIFSTFHERFGINAYVRGDYASAEKWFRKVEVLEPDSLSVLRNLGLILLARGDAEGAERYLLREEKLYGKSFHRHAAIADIAYARGKRKEAERRYALALGEPEAAPDGSAASVRGIMETRLAICRDEQRYVRTREAMKVFEDAQALSARREYEAAIRRFLESAELDETNWSALNNAGSLYLDRLKQPEKALEFFERAFAISRNLQVARNLDLTRRRRLGKAKGGK